MYAVPRSRAIVPTNARGNNADQLRTRTYAIVDANVVEIDVVDAPPTATAAAAVAAVAEARDDESRMARTVPEIDASIVPRIVCGRANL